MKIHLNKVDSYKTELKRTLICVCRPATTVHDKLLLAVYILLHVRHPREMRRNYRILNEHPFRIIYIPIKIILVVTSFTVSVKINNISYLFR